MPEPRLLTIEVPGGAEADATEDGARDTGSIRAVDTGERGFSLTVSSQSVVYNRRPLLTLLKV